MKENLASSEDSPKVSIISPSLSTAHYLRETIESIQAQSLKDIEHIVIDGGSTDGTIDILKEYPHVRWISENEEGDNGILDAIWKGVNLSRSRYVTYIMISDGFLDKDWLKESVRVLDSDPEVSAVWGIHQAISEDGHLGCVAWPEYLGNYPPPQKMEFLPFWLGCHQTLESNAIFRRDVFERCFPKNTEGESFRYFPPLGLNYNFNTMGYLPYFLPIIPWYGRTHPNQRVEKYHDMLDANMKQFDAALPAYRKSVFSGQVVHRFRDGNSNVIKEISKKELWQFKKNFVRHRVKHKLRKYFEKFMEHI